MSAMHTSKSNLTRFVEGVGRHSVSGIEDFGRAAALFFECLFWLLWGHRKHQPVRFNAVIQEAMNIGVSAAPICALLIFAVGIMLAIQGVQTLKTFGAESTVVIGIALSVTREFAPLIVSILVAGRSGSAITARIGAMRESQEVDALSVMGISPVRYLAAPILLAMLVMVPCLTILGDLAGLYGGAVYTSLALQIDIATYAQRSVDILHWQDLGQGLLKSGVFAIIIAMVGLTNGFKVSGGAEGVGRATTRSVVLSISLIIIADMLFTYLLNR